MGRLVGSIAAVFLAVPLSAQSQQQAPTFIITTSGAGPLPISESVASQFDQIFLDVGAKLGISRDDFALASFGSSPMAQQLPSLVPQLAARQGPNITVTFRPPGTETCPIRGTASPSPGSPGIGVFADSGTPREQVFGVLAHELGHLFQWLVIAKNSNGFGLFNEGFASWAAGKYWAAAIGMSSLQAAVGSYIESGTYVPLLATSNLRETIYPNAEQTEIEMCLARRDLMYTEWAAFIEFLVSTYGQETLYDFVRASTAARADPSEPTDLYSAHFGRSLEQLEADWLLSFR